MDEQLINIDQINPFRLILDLIKDLWVAVLIAAAVWLGFSAYEKLNYTPAYTSEATIVVSAKGGSGAYSSLSLTTNMAGVFSEIFQSNVLRERVEQHMGEPLDGYVSTRIVTNTNLMIISVVSGSPEKSFVALNTVLDIYPEITQTMLSNAVLEVINEPQVPLSPSNAQSMAQSRKQAVMIAFVMGLALVCAMSVLRPTVQTAAAAKRKIDGKLLRSVRHEVKNKTFKAVRQRRNVAPLITSHFTSAGFREDNQSLCAKLEYHMRRASQQVILVSSAGENEGKSTVAANLALSLASKGKRVALLDCDFRKPALHKIFEVKPEEDRSFAAALNAGEMTLDFLTHLPKRDIFVGVNASSSRYPQRLITSENMEQCLQLLRQSFDYVVLDTPPMLVAADTQALAALADVAVLVVREDYAHVRDINDCLDTLRRSCGDVAGFVLNNCLTTFKLS